MKNPLLLASIREPSDIRSLSLPQLRCLAEELRDVIVDTVTKNGGHLASNLGVVELTLALHRVFDSPEDKIVWDVGHQCYAHKLLTGRFDRFQTLRKANGLSGFPKRSESPHDAFDTGHSSTSVSAALGLLAGTKLLGQKGTTVAVIGDGALTGGLAYEGLCHAGQLGLPLVVILNDNKMSIGPNVGALSKHLSRLTMKHPYQAFRRKVDKTLKGVPFIGPLLFYLVDRFKKAIKAFVFQHNFFVDLGFEYVGPISGHDISLLEEVLADAKALQKPVVVHVRTHKGKGYPQAEEDPASFHGVAPQSSASSLSIASRLSFTDAFSSAMVEIGRQDHRVVAITAAMEKGTGLAAFHSAFPNRFFDVGIAEQHAVTFAAGLAARGLRPVVALYSTFLQRAVDQVIHDAALQNLPVVFALDRAGFVGEDGETHQGLFDVALLRGVPNLTILTPSTAEELRNSLRWALELGKPVAIRYPKDICQESEILDTTPLQSGRGVFVRDQGSPICLVFTGGLLGQAQGAADILEGEGLRVDLYAARFLKPLDQGMVKKLLSRYSVVVVAEECVPSGGLGEYFASVATQDPSSAQVVSCSASDRFPPQGTRGQLLVAAHLDAAGIASAVSAACRTSGRVSVLRPAR